jgi:hypothetical protein
VEWRSFWIPWFGEFTVFAMLSWFSREVVFDKAHGGLAHFYRATNFPIAEALREEDGNGEALLQHRYFGGGEKLFEIFRKRLTGSRSLHYIPQPLPRFAS